MKKTLTVLMMVLLAAMLIVSCDGSSKEPKSETPAETPTTPTTSTYTVTFDVNGGTGTFADKTTGTDGKVSKPETDPKKTNAVFLYWSKDKSTEFNFDTALTERTTLYAVWKTEFEVGDTGPAGGIIFYVASTEQTTSYTDSNGSSKTLTWKYLEVASGEATANRSDKIQWSSSDTGSYGSTATAIGSGLSNTLNLLSKSGVTFPAAQACATYGDNTDYDDWFLPSKDELNKIYENRNVLNTTFKEGTGDQYWSSSETSGNGTWRLDFNAGTWNNQVDRSIAWYVRPIRAFL